MLSTAKFTPTFALPATFSIIALSLASASARADSASHKEAQFMSNTGTGIFLVAGTLLPLAEDGQNGKQDALRTADAALTAVGFSEALSHLVHEERPNNSGDDSFPSSHAAGAFAVAAMESHYHPKQSFLWYGGATIIGLSRIQLAEHHSYDVAAGAALGFFTAKLELHQRHGLILFPFIRSASEGGGGGVQVSKAW